MSVVGSTIVLHHILKENKKDTFQRLMMGLCFSDIIHAINWGLGPLPNLKGYSLFAMGNQSTCSVNGFFMHTGQISFFYNVSIMCYFILTIRYRWRPNDFVNLETIMHILCVFLPLVEATTLASLGYFNPNLAEWGRCYVRAFPPDCDVLEDVECTRGAHARQLQFWAITVRGNALFAFLLFSLVLIVWTVRRSSQRMQRYAYSSVNISGAVTQQSIKYGLFFLFTYSFTAANLIEYNVSNREESIAAFVILLLREIFYPLQGFFTCLIYLQGKRSARISARIRTTMLDFTLRSVSNLLHVQTTATTSAGLVAGLVGVGEEDVNSSAAKSDDDGRDDLSVIEDKDHDLHDDDASEISNESDLSSTEYIANLNGEV